VTRFRKSDIQSHGGHPAINVKCYKFPHDLPDATGNIMEEFGCTEEVARQALEYAYETAVENFWQLAETHAREIFGPSAEVFSAGRSGGWLIVQGIGGSGDMWDEWNAPKVAKWGRFVRTIHAEMAYLGSWEQARETIEAHRWAEPGAGAPQLLAVDRKRIERAAPKLLEALHAIFETLSSMTLNDKSGAAEFRDYARRVARQAIEEAEGKGVTT